MDKKFIKVMIEEGRPIADIPQEEALTRLNNDIMTVYVMNGLHRGMQPEAFKEEVRTCTLAMYQELTTDPKYKTIRDKEIPYIFSNGMKGRLGTDKDIGLTYKNLIRWVEGYVCHQERRDALRSYYDDLAPKPKALPPHETTDDDRRRMVETAWEDFKEYKQKYEELKKSVEAEIAKKGYQKWEPKTIGDAMGRVPITCLDYGKMRIDYLRRAGYAGEQESLIDVFERAWKNGCKFEKVKV